MSGLWAVPRMTGRSGVSPRARWARTRSSSIAARICSSGIRLILFSSCDVRNPSKKNSTGTRDSSVATCATSARSCASCTDDAASIAKPTMRALITSEWSPKMDRACVAIALAATWKTQGVSSPAILYMLGSISRNPCDAVNVVVRAPLWSAPCTAPAAPPSDCICWMIGT